MRVRTPSCRLSVNAKVQRLERHHVHRVVGLAGSAGSGSSLPPRRGIVGRCPGDTPARVLAKNQTLVRVKLVGERVVYRVLNAAAMLAKTVSTTGKKRIRCGVQFCGAKFDVFISVLAIAVTHAVLNESSETCTRCLVATLDQRASPLHVGSTID